MQRWPHAQTTLSVVWVSLPGVHLWYVTGLPTQHAPVQSNKHRPVFKTQASGARNIYLAQDAQQLMFVIRQNANTGAALTRNRTPALWRSGFLSVSISLRAPERGERSAQGFPVNSRTARVPLPETAATPLAAGYERER